MDSFLKKLFAGTPASQPEASEEKERLAADEFNPEQANLDPKVRLKRGLKALFPHLPATPGLPPSRQAQGDD